MEKTLTLDIEAARAGLSEEEISGIEAAVRDLSVPKFATYQPDFEMMQKAREKYGSKKNLIIEGNGGSVSTLRGFVDCFLPAADKNVFILDTDDPDYIAELQEKCPPADTLFVVINRSGNSIQTVSGYLALRHYETIFVTARGSTLYQIGEKEGLALFDKTSEHPEFAGRFSGLTEFGLLPAAMLGMDARGLYEGGQEMYALCAPASPFANNPALRLAATLDKLEKLDYTEIFLSTYSKKLNGFFELIVQLTHESVCKEGKGQTVYGGDAPENQHHTLQRFNSGRDNSIGLFTTIGSFQNELTLSVPEEIRDIQCRNITIGKFTKLSMQDIIRTEFAGTWKDTVEKELPAIRLEVADVSPRSVGAFVAFWQYVTFYSAILRGVNPFDQPGVEKSKEYIFQLMEEK